MEIRIDISSLDQNEKWWNSMTIDERKDFLDKNKWADIQWAEQKWYDLHTGLKFFIHKNR